MSQFIRPTLRTHRGCHSEPRALTPEDTARVLRAAPTPAHRIREWTPSVEYELIARQMPPAVRAAYIAKSEAWFEAHPSKAWAASRRRDVIDTEMVAALLAKYGSRIPLEEYTKAGYSDEAVARVSAGRKWNIDHAEELQAEIERRWPGSSSSKPKKVIKAVKKKMS